MTEYYRIARSPLFIQGARLATARRYAQLADAFADMADGVVVDSDGEVVAFHERHLALMQRMAGLAAA